MLLWSQRCWGHQVHRVLATLLTRVGVMGPLFSAANLLRLSFYQEKIIVATRQLVRTRLLLRRGVQPVATDVEFTRQLLFRTIFRSLRMDDEKKGPWTRARGT